MPCRPMPCREATGSDARWHWVDDAALQAAGVAPWTGLPLWLPEDDAAFGGMLMARHERAAAAGLRCRPVLDTVRATWDWLQRDANAVCAPADALTPEREAELLAAR